MAPASMRAAESDLRKTAPICLSVKSRLLSSGGPRMRATFRGGRSSHESAGRRNLVRSRNDGRRQPPSHRRDRRRDGEIGPRGPGKVGIRRPSFQARVTCFVPRAAESTVRPRVLFRSKTTMRASSPSSRSGNRSLRRHLAHVRCSWHRTKTRRRHRPSSNRRRSRLPDRGHKDRSRCPSAPRSTNPPPDRGRRERAFLPYRGRRSLWLDPRRPPRGANAPHAAPSQARWTTRPSSSRAKISGPAVAPLSPPFTMTLGSPAILVVRSTTPKAPRPCRRTMCGPGGHRHRERMSRCHSATRPTALRSQRACRM